MNLLIDPVTGCPRWDASSQSATPKEDFALETARRLQSGAMSLETLKDQIIAAGNLEWATKGGKGELKTLNDVKDKIGKSGKDWFFEIQRVADHPELLQELIDQEGRGLTALSRRAGPIQAQRRKGHSDPCSTTLIRDLISVLEKTRQAILDQKVLSQPILSQCAADLAKYRAFLTGLA
jgi:hypothetical protein